MTHSTEGPRRDSRTSSDVRPSTVRLPEQTPEGIETIFEFFVQRFPRISRETWADRFATGKVWAVKMPIDNETPYRPLLDVHYRREVEHEPPVRKDFRIVWSDRHLMVVDKPPNLPVTPGGHWVRGCLLHLLHEASGNRDITPLHRLDRLTSGLVLLSLDPTNRAHYSYLFRQSSAVEKIYTAVCEVDGAEFPRSFTLAHHITRSLDEYWRQIVVPGRPANARSEVEIISVSGNLALARIRPITGRKHQIRVQLAHEGLPILGDPLYGTVRSYRPGDLSQRLWLDAHRLSINAFPGHEDEAMLNGDWTSSRAPDEFFERAVAAHSSPASPTADEHHRNGANDRSVS